MAQVERIIEQGLFGIVTPLVAKVMVNYRSAIFQLAYSSFRAMPRKKRRTREKKTGVGPLLSN
jgi:hypothetical protein